MNPGRVYVVCGLLALAVVVTIAANPSVSPVRVVTLGRDGCTTFSDGVSVCVKGAPAGSVLFWFLNGSMIVITPGGKEMNCSIYIAESGSCQVVVGIP